MPRSEDTAPRDDIAIDVEGLSKSFDGKQVVRNLSLQVRRGQIYGFLGPNGSGKTTTLRMICGLLTPDGGRGTCLGYDILTEREKIKRLVGYMTQRFSLYQDLSIKENLEFVARLYGLPNPGQAVKQAIERLGLQGRELQLAGTLSGGWKQRLALGACILPKPDLLLLDEPTAGVDPKARREFWGEIHKLAADGMTVLVSTHYMDEAERCHEIAYIAYGELLAQGTIPQVIEASHLRTYTVSGPEINDLAEKLVGMPGVDMVAPFGTNLHVAGRDADALDATVARVRRRRHVESIGTLARGRLHRFDVQITGQFPMTALALPRWPGALVRTAAMFTKEFVQLRRDRLTFGTMIFIPLVQLTLFGFAINTTPRHLPTAVLAYEDSDVGRSILAALRNTTYFDLVQVVRSEDEMDRLMRSGKVLFGVEIPAGFERAVRRGDRPALLVAADASDPVAAGTALAALEGVVSSALARDRGLPETTRSVTAFEIRQHRRYNPAAVTSINIVPGLLGVILTMTMLIFTALSVTREIERGTMESLLAMPIQPLEIMIGKITPYVVIGFMQATLILAFGTAVFEVPIYGSIGLLALLSTLFIATNLSIGYTFSTIAQNQLQAIQMSFMFFLPNILLSGFMFPFAGMPGWAQVIGELLPLTHYIRIVRGIMLKGADLYDLHREALALLALMTLAMTFAVRRFRTTLD